jgi:BirA family transcriptional regulator, biotin operon repressor / biotin---[acetyl-CoA-carboxylase] ligase
LSRNFLALIDAPVIELDSIDSTNNYAMRLIDADTAQPGMTITAREQTQGRGQRGRKWTGVPGESLLMSLITAPVYPLSEQFVFNAAATTAIIDVLQKLSENWELAIKWPNDIIINDKKAGGILIENILRGSNWLYAIIGFGLNIKQVSFPDDLPYATSLKIASGKVFDPTSIRDMLREKILEYTNIYKPANEVMDHYNSFLYRQGKQQRFSNETGEWEATILHANANGTLQVQLGDGSIVPYTHGMVMWEWGSDDDR